MNGKIGFVSSLLLFVAGIILIVLHTHINILRDIVIFLGIMLIIPGVINISYSAFSRKAEKAETTPSKKHAYVFGLVASVFFICLGIAMLLAPTFFAGLIAYLFAAILVAIGVYHVLVLAYLARPFVMPFYFYIVPVLMIVAGCVILFSSVRTLSSIVVLITGISLVCSSVNALLEYVGTHPLSHAHIPEHTTHEGK